MAMTWEHANGVLVDTILPRIEAADTDEAHRRKMDWLGLEHTLRDIVKLGMQLTEADAGKLMHVLNDALAAYTGRGPAHWPRHDADDDYERAI